MSESAKGLILIAFIIIDFIYITGKMNGKKHVSILPVLLLVVVFIYLIVLLA
ncbi:MAG: hypothetical protein IKL53_08310 [Lachnospiraceae bacterium]|nr:hypothetical protein [Lachnospiraceae bacterium]